MPLQMTSAAAEEEEEGEAAAEEESPAWQQHYDVARVRRLEAELARLRESEAAAHDRERQVICLSTLAVEAWPLPCC